MVKGTLHGAGQGLGSPGFKQVVPDDGFSFPSSFVKEKTYPLSIRANLGQARPRALLRGRATLAELASAGQADIMSSVHLETTVPPSWVPRGPLIPGQDP